MKTINCNEPPLAEAVPATQDERPMKCLESSRAAEPGELLAQENKRLTQENTRLAQERDLLRTLIDSLPDLIFVKDRQSRFLINNLAHVRTLGATHPEEVAGKTDLDIFPAEPARQYYGDEQALMESGRPLNRKETVVNPHTGEKCWVQTTKMPLRDQSGKVVGLMGISRDITEHKQAEETLARERSLLRTLIDNLPDCIYAKDASGRKILANPADLKNLHCKTESDAIGKTDFDLFPRNIAEKFYTDDMNVIHGQPFINREEYVSDDDGGTHWLLTSKLPLRDQNGKIIGLVGIGRDITERKRAEDSLRSSEAKLRQSTVQLERSNHELQDFAYVASHDLQEPLRKIVVFGERLKEKKIEDLGPEAKDYLERMQKAAARMQTLINDLLTFSRVTTKARPFTPVNLAEVAADVVNDLEGRI